MERIYPDGLLFPGLTALALVWRLEQPGYSFNPHSSPFLSALFSCSRTATSAPLLSLIRPPLSRCLTCLPLPGTASPQNCFVPSRPSPGSVPGPSGQFWGGTKALRSCRALCDAPAPAPRSLRSGLLVSVSKVTPTASRSSPELPAGIPDALHPLGFVPHCLSQFSRTFLHPAAASSLGEHRLRPAEGRAGLCSAFSPEKLRRDSGLSIQEQPRASLLSWRHIQHLFLYSRWQLWGQEQGQPRTGALRCLSVPWSQPQGSKGARGPSRAPAADTHLQGEYLGTLPRDNDSEV